MFVMKKINSWNMQGKRFKISIKRVYDRPGNEDGTRILVDRVWPRGLTREGARIDVWLKDIAPSSQLRKWFGHDPARFDEFSKLYRAELDMKGDLVDRLVTSLEEGPVTLLYAAHDNEHNHARVLFGYLGERLKTLSPSAPSAGPVEDDDRTHTSHS